MEPRAQEIVDWGEFDEQSTHFIWKVTKFKNVLALLLHDDKKYSRALHDMEPIRSEGIPSVLQKYSTTDRVKLSDNFYCDKLHITFRIGISRFGEHLKVSMCYVDTHDSKCNSETTCSLYAIKFTLLDQGRCIEKKHIRILETPLFKQPIQMNRGLSLAPFWLFLQQPNTYVKDNSVFIKLSLIPLALMCKSVASTNGILLWRIENYSRLKQDAIMGVKECLLSPSFYTAPQVYRVQAITYLNGKDEFKGKFISIYVSFIAGEFDKDLAAKFNCMITLILIDQTDDDNDKEHVRHDILVPYHEDKLLQGRHDFVLISKAEEDRYLKNDTLLFKIVVKII